MMSRKLSGKRLFERLLQQEYIQRAWAEGVIIIILLFSLPVSVALELGHYTGSLDAMPDRILLDFMAQNNMLFLMVFLLSIFTAVLEYGYLFQRNKVDFFHSLPISRNMQFLYRYLTGFLLFAVPYLVLYGIAVLVGIAHGAMIVGYVKKLACLAVVYLVFFWVLYSVSIIAVQLAGSYLSSVVTLLFLHFGGPCFCILIQECQRLFLRTYVDTGQAVLYGEGSAITICMGILEQFQMTGYYNSFSLTVLAVMALLLPVAGYLLFWGRSAEKSSCGLAYPLVGPVICFMTVTGVGVLTGIFLRTMSYSDSDFWLYFGVLAGCVIMHCIMQMILQMDFRAFFQNRISMLICTCFAVIFMCIFRFDLTGYDSYLPSADQLDSAGVFLTEMEYYRSYLRDYTNEEFEKLVERNAVFNATYSSQEQCSILSQMNLKNVQPILTLAEESIQDKSWKEYGNMTVCYRLKNGRCVYRNYLIRMENNLAECSEIFAMDRYKEALYPILLKGEENCTIWLNDSYSSNKKSLKLEDTEYITLLRTYKRELKELTMETMAKEEPQLLLEFTESQDGYFNSYPVYPSFKHTLTLLSGYGYQVSSGPDFIYKARISYNAQEGQMDDESYLIGSEGEQFEGTDGTSYPSEQYNDLWTEDEEQLKDLRPYLISSYYRNNNMTLIETEPGFYVTGYMTNKETGEEMVSEFLIEKGKLPEFLQKMKEAAQKNVG